jgi:mono/diheme cytochrome c family protein
VHSLVVRPRAYSEEKAHRTDDTLQLLTLYRKEFLVTRPFALASIVIAFAYAATPSHAQSGADTYKAKCMMCHAADGSGSTPAGKSMGAIPFSSAALIKASDSDLIAATTNGKGKMPAYNGKLTAPQIAATITYIRTLQK